MFEEKSVRNCDVYSADTYTQTIKMIWCLVIYMVFINVSDSSGFNGMNFTYFLSFANNLNT